MPSFSHRGRRFVVIAGLLIALILGSLGHGVCRSGHSPVSSGGNRIRELDRRAQPFFEQAHRNVTPLVCLLTEGTNLAKLGWMMAKDKLSGDGCRTRDYLHQTLQKPILEPCAQAARIYGIAVDGQALAEDTGGIVADQFHASLYAAGGLAMEAVFIKSTIASIKRVVGAIIGRFAGVLGKSVACAALDGPFPVGDLLGAVLAVGGTALCLRDLADSRKELAVSLESELHQAIDSCRNTCREAVLQ